MNEVARLLGIEHPVIQGAMGVISNPEMVAAVSEAGGLGLLATAFLTDPEKLKPQIEATRRLTDKPFGANLMALNPINEAMARILAEMGVTTVTTSGGLPKPLIDMLKDRGLKVLHVVSSASAAVKAEAAGVDAVIAEGAESGGIQGFTVPSTMVLVPLVADSVKLPVIAAGGIADRRGFRAALALGAQGVQVGTRFIASTECIAHSNYKQALIQARETDTMLVSLGRIQARVIRTPYAEKAAAPTAEGHFSSMGGSLEDAWVRGDLDANTIPAGQVTGLIREIRSAREIVEELVA